MNTLNNQEAGIGKQRRPALARVTALAHVLVGLGCVGLAVYLLRMPHSSHIMRIGALVLAAVVPKALWLTPPRDECRRLTGSGHQIRRAFPRACALG